MKKGIFAVLGLLGLGLALGFVYGQKDLGLREYEKVILKNEYGEFEIPLKMIIIQREKSVSATVICSESDIEFKAIPSQVGVMSLLQKNMTLYAFRAILVDAKSGSLREGQVFLIDDKGTRIAGPVLEIRTKSFEVKKLEDWQILLKKAYDFQFPVTVKGKITDIIYAGPRYMRYLLIIDICDIHR